MQIKLDSDKKRHRNNGLNVSNFDKNYKFIEPSSMNPKIKKHKENNTKA